MKHPWTNVYGVARSLMALGLLSTLLFSNIDVLFQPAVFKTLQEVSPVNRLGFFYLFAGSRSSLEAGRWLAIVLLALVASGWRPRYTGVLHWWLSFSFAVASTVAEGGDQINAILCLFLVPVTLMDERLWHWAAWTSRATALGQRLRGVAADSCVTMIRIQVSIIYLHAAVSKLAVREWADGTAVYYWFTHPVYGMNHAVQSLVMPVLTSPIGVTALTWAVILTEILLASALVMDRRHFSKLLLLGLAFHFGIVVAHGLASFFFAMAGALVLYLRPTDRPFRLPAILLRRSGPLRVIVPQETAAASVQKARMFAATTGATGLSAAMSPGAGAGESGCDGR